MEHDIKPNAHHNRMSLMKSFVKWATRDSDLGFFYTGLFELEDSDKSQLKIWDGEDTVFELVLNSTKNGTLELILTKRVCGTQGQSELFRKIYEELTPDILSRTVAGTLEAEEYVL